MNKRIIFAGGTDWSVEFLETLLAEGFNVVGVLAPTDKRREREQKKTAHALKIAAEKKNIAVLQPEKLNDPNFLDKFKQLEPDLVVVVAYGKLFPQEILAIPPLGFINFHPSLLPQLRGPAPIICAILEGLEKTGISIMKLGEGMDDGPILFQQEVKIDPRETNETLTRKLVELGKKELPAVLKRYIEGKIIPQPQPEKGVTVCKLIKKEDGRIDWANETAEQIDRKIRALNPQFKTFNFLPDGRRVNILESAGISNLELPPGQYRLENNNLTVGTKSGALLISKIQLQGKNPITAGEFFRGYNKGVFVS
jgi:methionyl-tRNA formyltransferase